MAPPKRRGRPPFPDELTPAEWRVVHGVQHGLSNRTLASRLGVSPQAVKYHVGNVLAKLGLAGRDALRHWHRAPRSSALYTRESTLDTPLKIGALGQVSRSVSDIDTSVAWYRDRLGLAHLYTFGKLAFFDLAGTRLLLTEKDVAAADESILYLRVADIVAAHAALGARGVEFLNAPHRIYTHGDGTEEWMAFFKDPDGRPLAIMSQVSPPPAHGQPSAST